MQAAVYWHTEVVEPVPRKGEVMPRPTDVIRSQAVKPGSDLPGSARDRIRYAILAAHANLLGTTIRFTTLDVATFSSRADPYAHKDTLLADFYFLVALLGSSARPVTVRP